MTAAEGTGDRGPIVRVEEAGVVGTGGPVRVVVSRLDRIEEVADAAASAGGTTAVVDGRLHATIVPSRLVDAAGRTGGAALAEPLRQALEAAIVGWSSRPGDVETRAGTLACSKRSLVMGIVNVTPDSFSDGGRLYRPDRDPGPAIDHARALLDAGADLVDVGGESTRPGAEPVAEDEELARVLPVVETLAGEGAIVSIDTSKAVVARRAVAAGAALVNDVSAGGLDGLLLRTVVELDVPYVVMHRRGTPRTMQRDPRYADVVAEVHDFLAEQVDRVVRLGLPRERIVVDPGIGFGKTLDHNLELLRRLRELTSLGLPVLVGASRKSFLGHLTGADTPRDRLEASITAAAHAVANGAAIVRVHDVAQTVRAVAVADRLRR